MDLSSKKDKPSFFNFSTPQHLLDKAIRELERFEKDPSVDNAFNLFCSISHIQDWAEACNIPMNELINDRDFQLCRLACNQGKHGILTHKNSIRISVEHQYSSHADTAFFGSEVYAILADNERIPVATLGRRVISKIKQVLKKEG